MGDALCLLDPLASIAGHPSTWAAVSVHVPGSSLAPPTCLVRTDDRQTAQCLHARQLADNCILPGHHGASNLQQTTHSACSTVLITPSSISAHMAQSSPMPQPRWRSPAPCQFTAADVHRLQKSQHLDPPFSPKRVALRPHPARSQPQT